MFDLDTWGEIWATITRNKVRSFLTCFGVFWGILMLIILLGSGRGMKNGVFAGTEGFATNSAFFWTESTSEPYKGFKKGRYWQMRNRDAMLIKQNVEGISYLSPITWGARSDKNIAYGQRSGGYSVKGIYPDYFHIEAQEVYEGRLLNDVDQMESRKVCNIGVKVREVLFPNGEEAIGKYIRVNGIYYQVVGVIKGKAANFNMGGRSEESVMLPFSTMQITSNQGDAFYFMCLSAKPGYRMEEVIDQVTAILKAQNDISSDDRKAVGCFNLAANFRTFENLFVGIDILVWLVGMGTLLAGVIGVSNIMMVTVKERTKEIGIRRALGAKPWNIISQIMSESLLLTALAGLIGLTVGVFILDSINRLIESAPSDDGTFFKDPEVSITTAIAATVVLLLSGLLSGLIPAWRAMQIKAIDAIREE